MKVIHAVPDHFEDGYLTYLCERKKDAVSRLE